MPRKTWCCPLNDSRRSITVSRRLGWYTILPACGQLDMDRKRKAAWQTDQNQRFSWCSQSETISGCAVYSAHGLCRDQRSSARQHGSRTRSVWLPMESRAVSLRDQTTDWYWKLSVPQSSNCPKSYWLCHAGLDTPETSRRRNSTNYLWSQTRFAFRLLAPATQITVDSNDSCVSPIMVIFFLSTGSFKSDRRVQPS